MDWSLSLVLFITIMFPLFLLQEDTSSKLLEVIEDDDLGHISDYEFGKGNFFSLPSNVTHNYKGSWVEHLTRT